MSPASDTLPHSLHSLPSVPETAYATAWSSPWTDPENGILSEADLTLLAHVNCSYLSSGRPPTLLALKQHAQALTNLIRKLTVSSTFGIVGEGSEDEGSKFSENEAFDWLNDLNTRYENADPSHHLPLWAVANQIEAEDEVTGIETHCPLKKIRSDDEKSDKRPYATHQNLVMHANECLEFLDHEYSATGGLMSILPTEYEEDKNELEGARNSFLGQWLLHHQHMIARLHELEINYSNALDMIAGLHFQPGHVDTNKGEMLITDPAPQHRFVLVNAGQDVFDKMHEMMDRAEGLIERKQEIWWGSGVTGERTWNQDRGGKFYTKGLIPMDFVTRFFRAKGQGKGTVIYMMPAIQMHPGVSHTRAAEYPPKIVSVVAPKWAERVTAYEQRRREQKEADEEALQEGERSSLALFEIRSVLAAQEEELKQATKALAFYEARVNTDDRSKIKELLQTVGEYEERFKRIEEFFPEEYKSCLAEENTTS